MSLATIQLLVVSRVRTDFVQRAEQENWLIYLESGNAVRTELRIEDTQGKKL